MAATYQCSFEDPVGVSSLNPQGSHRVHMDVRSALRSAWFVVLRAEARQYSPCQHTLFTKNSDGSTWVTWVLCACW